LSPALSAGAAAITYEMNKENRKIPDMFERFTASLSGILFSMNEYL